MRSQENRVLSIIPYFFRNADLYIAAAILYAPGMRIYQMEALQDIKLNWISPMS